MAKKSAEGIVGEENELYPEGLTITEGLNGRMA